MNIVEVFSFWIITASLGVTLAAPLGPINLEMIKNALNTSVTRRTAWFSTFLVGIGAMTGDFMIAFSALTLGGEVLESIFSNLWIKLLLFALNFIILSYLGVSTLFEEPIGNNTVINPDIQSEKSFKQANLLSLSKKYFTGFSMVVTSPWTYLWWTSVGTIIIFSDFSLPDLFSRLIVVTMFLSGIFLWTIALTTTITIIGSSPKPKFFSVITKGSAIILLVFALVILRDMLITFGEIINW